MCRAVLVHVVLVLVAPHAGNNKVIRKPIWIKNTFIMNGFTFRLKNLL